MKEKLRKLLGNLENFNSLVEKAKEDNKLDELVEALTELTNEEATNFSEKELELISKLVEGDNEINLDENFKNFSETATVVFEDWNESAARLAVSMYLKAGNEIIIESEEVITLGELWGLESDHALYSEATQLTEAKRTEMEDSSFLGENKTIPVVDTKTALIAAKLGKLKDTAFGVSVNENGEIFCDVLYNESGEALAKFDVESDLDEVSSVVESFGKTITVEAMKDLQENLKKDLDELLKDFSENSEKSTVVPEIVTDKEIVSLYMSKEYSGNEYFAPLVGLVRKYGITKEDFETASSSYNIFSASTLEKLLEKAWNESTQASPVGNPLESTNNEPSAEVEPLAPTPKVNKFRRLKRKKN